jgi:deoxycytidine triphosphate deaminase
MGRFLTENELIAGLGPSGFIQNGDRQCAEGIKYDFRLSPQILKSSFKRPIDASRLSEREKGDLSISPGEMIFVLSEERLNLPSNIVAHLSPKRKLSHAGVLAIGGFCIDPGYKGRLLIGLYNFSSTNFPLITGKKVIAATFYQLSPEEIAGNPHPEAAVEDFPEELIRMIANYEPMSVKSVADLVKQLSHDLDAMRNEIRSHEDWYKRFQESLDEHNDQIGQLTAGLTAEKESRSKGEDSLTQALHELKGTMSWLRGAAYVLLGLLAIVAIPLLTAWFEGKLKISP